MSYVNFFSDTSAVHNLYPSFHGKRAYDIGANGGVLASIFAQKFDEVIAFEPCQESFEQLESLNVKNVFPVNAAVSDVDGTVVLEETPITGRWGELVTREQDSVMVRSWGEKTGEREVPALTLDTVASLWGPPDFVKIDTEGHEPQVVRGGLEMFRKYRPTVLIEIHDERHGPVVSNLLHGYTFERFDHERYTSSPSLQRNHYWLLGTK